MKRFKLKKISAVVLSLLIVMSLLPAATFAAAGSLSYNANGGNGSALPSPINVNTPTNVFITLVKPTRAGREFLGWAENNAATVATYQPGGKIYVDQTITLYAVWSTGAGSGTGTNPTFSLTYDAGGGTPVPTARTYTAATATYVSTLTPQMPGKTFKYWANYADRLEYNPGAAINVNGDIVLNAIWNDTSSTVAFEAYGGLPVPISQNVLYGSTVVIPAIAPGKTGYTFGGWYEFTGTNLSDPADYTLWNFNNKVYNNLVLYAKWIPDSCTVTFDADGGSPVPSQQTIDYGVNITKPAIDPVKTGYTFGGWYYVNAVTNDMVSEWQFGNSGWYVQSDITLRAKWRQITFDVTYELYGGSFDDSSQQNPVNVPYAGKVTAPGSVTRPGYHFDGWFEFVGTNVLDPADYAPWNFNTEIYGDVVLYARWLEEFEVSFVLTGQVNADNLSDPQFATQIVPSGWRANKPNPDPVSEHYEFTIWSYEVSAGVWKVWDFDTPVTSDLVLHVNFIEELYTATFMVDGTEFLKLTDIPYNTAVSQPSPNPGKPGFTFLRWINQATNTQWYFSNKVVEDLVLIAQWNEESYTVTYNPNGGPSAPASETGLAYGAKISKPADPEWAGKAFVLWSFCDPDYPDNGGWREWDFNTDTVKRDTVLWANWVTAYSVTFNQNGGTDITVPQSIKAGGKVIEPATPSRAGYTFALWSYQDLDYPDNGGWRKWDFSTDVVPSNDITLFANWTANPVIVTYDYTDAGGTWDDTTKVYGDTADEYFTPWGDVHGFTFMYWYESDPTVPYNHSTPLTGDITLFAKWADDAAFPEIMLDFGTFTASQITGTYPYYEIKTNASDVTINSIQAFLSGVSSSSIVTLEVIPVVNGTDVVSPPPGNPTATMTLVSDNIYSFSDFGSLITFPLPITTTNGYAIAIFVDGIGMERITIIKE